MGYVSPDATIATNANKKQPVGKRSSFLASQNAYTTAHYRSHWSPTAIASGYKKIILKVSHDHNGHTDSRTSLHQEVHCPYCIRSPARQLERYFPIFLMYIVSTTLITSAACTARLRLACWVWSSALLSHIENTSIIITILCSRALLKLLSSSCKLGIKRDMGDSSPVLGPYFLFYPHYHFHISFLTEKSLTSEDRPIKAPRLGNR